MTLPIMSCKAERNFSKLSAKKHKLWSTILEERQNYLSIRSVGNDVIKSSYEEVIKQYAVKKYKKV